MYTIVFSSSDNAHIRVYRFSDIQKFIEQPDFLLVVVDSDLSVSIQKIHIEEPPVGQIPT